MYFSPLREVSGDVYNFFEYKKHKHIQKDVRGLFFADASGHGVSAALITTVLLQFLDEIAQEEFKPSILLSRLNQMMTDKMQSSYFATGVFFLFDATGPRSLRELLVAFQIASVGGKSLVAQNGVHVLVPGCHPANESGAMDGIALA